MNHLANNNFSINYKHTTFCCGILCIKNNISYSIFTLYSLFNTFLDNLNQAYANVFGRPFLKKKLAAPIDREGGS